MVLVSAILSHGRNWPKDVGVGHFFSLPPFAEPTSTFPGVGNSYRRFGADLRGDA